MKRDMLVAGALGFFVGAVIYASASGLSRLLPILVQGFLLVAIVFVFLFAIAAIEIPVMVFGMRQIVRSTSPRRLLVGTFGIYVAFASVYASAFVLLTGEILLGLVLAGLACIRLASGVWIR